MLIEPPIDGPCVKCKKEHLLSDEAKIGLRFQCDCGQWLAWHIEDWDAASPDIWLQDSEPPYAHSMTHKEPT